MNGRDAVIAIAVLLSGCASPQPSAERQSLLAQASQPLYCKGKEQCDLYWQRAQIFISKSSGYKIQTATDSIIETYGPMGYKVDLAMKATKVPMAGGAEIEITAGCANLFGCMPDRLETIAKAKAYIRASDALLEQPTNTPSNKRTVPAVLGKYAIEAERIAKSAKCTDQPMAELTANAPSVETYNVLCDSGDVISVRCEYGQCRALR